MEYTSVLAGERFSDSPACTDPVLAALARAVNDYTGDSARQRLAPLAGDLTTACGAGDEVARRITRRAVLTALPYASGDRRRVLVVALLGLERACAGVSRGFDRDLLSLDAELGLLGCDREVDEAEDSLRRLPVPVAEHTRRGLAMTVEIAVATIADEATDADDVLCRLLEDSLADYTETATTSGAVRASFL